jgi:hypothetical protein
MERVYCMPGNDGSMALRKGKRCLELLEEKKHMISKGKCLSLHFSAAGGGKK